MLAASTTPATQARIHASTTAAVLTTVMTVLALLLVSAPAPAEAAQVTEVVRWSDGDTVVTTHGRVRLIGIDTPEVGTCGAKKATRIARRLAPVGSTIKLVNPTSVANEDRYDRKLRYVLVGGVDIGLRQIRKGAQARYDGLDGYDKHPRQGKYRKADRNNADHCSK